MTRKMKDSGVEWIGEIPEEWDVLPLKRIFSERSGGAWGEEAHGNDGDLICIRVADFDYPHLRISKKIEYTKRNYSKNDIDKLLLKPEDILIEKSGGGDLTPVGRVVIYLENFPAVYANFIERLRVNEEHYPKYIEYLLSTLYNTTLSFKYIKQTTGIQNFDISTFLSKENIALPCRNDQTRLASFLDTKSSLIDSTIEKEREVIGKLKEYRQAVITEAVTKGIRPGVPMKDSGVEWIGEIPSDWSIGKIKYTTSKIGSGKTPKGGSETYSEEGILFLRSQNIYDNGLNIEEATFISENIDEEMANTRVYPDDVLLNITGASIGRCCLYPSKMSYANVNQHVCIIRVIVNTMIPEYVHYFWISSSGQTSIDIYQSGANREGLNFEQIGNTVIPYPPLPEQQEIADYLDKKCSGIDATIQKRELAIEKLTAYKQSLIYECVTGKREVAA